MQSCFRLFSAGTLQLYPVYSMLLHVSGPCSVRARTKLEIICLDARPSSEHGPPIGRGWSRDLNTGPWLATWYRATSPEHWPLIGLLFLILAPYWLRVLPPTMRWTLMDRSGSLGDCSPRSDWSACTSLCLWLVSLDVRMTGSVRSVEEAYCVKVTGPANGRHHFPSRSRSRRVSVWEAPLPVNRQKNKTFWASLLFPFRFQISNES